MFPHHSAINAEQDRTAPTGRAQRRGKRETTTASNEGFITKDGDFTACVRTSMRAWPNSHQKTNTNKHSGGLREETRPRNCRKGVNGILRREQSELHPSATVPL